MPLRARHTRSARLLRPHARERRCAHNLLESTKPLQNERIKIEDAPTRQGEPNLGVDQKEGERAIDL